MQIFIKSFTRSKFNSDFMQNHKSLPQISNSSFSLLPKLMNTLNISIKTCEAPQSTNLIKASQNHTPSSKNTQKSHKHDKSIKNTGWPPRERLFNVISLTQNLIMVTINKGCNITLSAS